MVHLTALASLFAANRNSQRYEQPLILGSNQIQHRLLSHPTSQFHVDTFAQDSADPCRTLSLAELTRIAALIFSDMVFFPLPWSLGVKQRLARRMRHIWENARMARFMDNAQTEHLQLCTWILWFGTLAAVWTGHREWFEAELYQVLQRLYGPDLAGVTFDSMREMFHGFLWWEYTCDLPSQGIWERMLGRAQGTGFVSTLVLRRVDGIADGY